MKWLLYNFYLGEKEQEIESLCENPKMEFCFMCVTKKLGLRLTFDEGGGCEVWHDDIEVCGNIVQSLLQFLKIEELASTAHFPLSADAVNNVIDTVSKLLFSIF